MEYMLKVRVPHAIPVRSRFGYLNSRIGRSGLIGTNRTCCPHVSRISLMRGRSIVSGNTKMTSSNAITARPDCTQNITRQVVNVTMTPPTKGPNAGPICVPLSKNPIPVPRSVYVRDEKHDPYRLVDISNCRRSDHKKRRGSQRRDSAEYEKRDQIWAERCSDGR